MGQYYIIVNLDKKEYLKPHEFGDGAKLLEFGSSGDGTMLGLAILLAHGNNRGGGDLRSDNPLIGSWRGDRIIVTGDYANALEFIEASYQELKEVAEKCNTSIGNLNLYAFAKERFRDISKEVIEVLKADPYLRDCFNSKLRR